MSFDLHKLNLSKLSFSELMQNLDKSDNGIGDLSSSAPVQILPAPGENQHLRRFGASASLQQNPVENTGPQAALDLIRTSLDSELGPGGADKVLQDAGLTGVQSITGRELTKVSLSFNKVRQEMSLGLEDPNRPSIKKWQDIANQKTPSKEMASNLTVEQLLAHPQAQWSVSDSGATGALIVKLPDGRGAVVKIEAKDTVERVDKLAGLMEDAISGPDGFNIPSVTAHTDLTPEDPVVQGLIGKLETLQQLATNDPIKLAQIKSHLKNLKDPSNLGTVGVSKMEFAPGIQVNKLPLDDKMALLQTGVLAEQVGKATVLAPLMGLKDHMSLGNQRSNANLSNFLVDPTNGRLAPIDLDAENLNHGTDKPVFYGHSDAAGNIETLAKELNEKLSTEKGQNELIDLMISLQDPKSQIDSPLAPGLELLTVPERAEGLFDMTGSAGYQRTLMRDALQSPELKEKQAISMLKGLVSGLKYVQENGENMKQAFLKHGQGMSGEDFDRVTKSVEGMDLAKMEQQLTQREEQIQSKGIEYAKLLENKKQELQKDLLGNNKANLDMLNGNVDRYKTRLNTLEDPGILDRLRALRYGGVKGAKQAFTEKHEGAVAQKVAFDRLLDKTLDENLKAAKSEVWNEAHQKVQSEQAKQPLHQKLDSPTQKLGTQQNVDQGLELSETEARQLLKALNKLNGEPKQGDLSLSEKEAGELLQSLDKLSNQPKESRRDSLKLNDQEAQELLKALDNLSPEKLKQAQEKSETVEITDERLDQMIEDLKSMDIDEPSQEQTQQVRQRSESENPSNEDIDKMIEELKSVDVEQPSESVAAKLHMNHVGSGNSQQKQKLGEHHKLREEVPELVHDQGQKQQGPKEGHLRI